MVNVKSQLQRLLPLLSVGLEKIVNPITNILQPERFLGHGKVGDLCVWILSLPFLFLFFNIQFEIICNNYSQLEKLWAI